MNLHASPPPPWHYAPHHEYPRGPPRHPHWLIAAPGDGDGCGPPGGVDIFFHLRVAAIFIMLVTSTLGAVFPVIAAHGRWHVHPLVFEYVQSVWLQLHALMTCAGPVRCRFVKFFGSGVIVRPKASLVAPTLIGSPTQIATAFIHLLAPAFASLSSPCLPSGWEAYVRRVVSCLS